ncbi:hypothetical protein Tco_0712326 [Tanacetum coccineum]
MVRYQAAYYWDDGEGVIYSLVWKWGDYLRSGHISSGVFFGVSQLLVGMSDYGDGLHSDEEMAEDGFGAYWLGSERLIPDKDLVRRLCHMMISCRTPSVPVSMGAFRQMLFRHAKGRKSGARLSGGHFIGCLAAYFRLVSDQRGLSVVTRELLLIDLHKLERLNICVRVGDTWAWVAPEPERQPDAAAGAPGSAKDAFAVDEGAQADLIPVQAPQHRHLPLGLCNKGLPGSRRRMVQLHDSAVDACRSTYKALIAIVGSLQLPYQRRTRRRIDDANTSALQQPDP